MTILSRTDKGVSAAGTWALGSLQGRPEDGQQDTPAFQSWASETVAAANIWLVAAGINTSLKSIRALPVPLQGAAFHWEEKGPVAASLMGPKRYEYRVSPGADFDSEFRGNQGGYLAWQVPEKLDVEAMREAAAALVGTHNFAAFTSQHGWDKDPAGSEAEILVVSILVSVYGVNFLYLMVRYIAFALVLVGRGAAKPHFDSLSLLRKGRPPGVPSVGLRPAPAHGLCLAELQIEEAPSLESIRGVLAQGKPKSRRETREAANSLDARAMMTPGPLARPRLSLTTLDCQAARAAGSPPSADGSEAARSEFFSLTPRKEIRGAARRSFCQRFPIEAEFAEWSKECMPEAVAAENVFNLSPRGSASSQSQGTPEVFHIEEEELSSMTAVQALREMGPGKSGAEAAWRACVLREKLRLARSIADRRASRNLNGATGRAQQEEEEEDLELCPDSWPEPDFRPLASDFAFNFSALDLAEKECESLLLRVVTSWRLEASRLRGVRPPVADLPGSVNA
ncbi:unnamed protein product [Polarella glacialis]|uniref:Pseudouridine synthase I TruA alpha/beta domain-containing protein n=1 Tax=Polarella glacialis TaxID=89957 RepID=A0A813HLC0_POLGL|nr:unnamed protein product [Polarella glacialis]